MNIQNHHHRQSIRLQGYDYSKEGAYFTTIVTNQRDCSFGEINDSEMKLNELGIIVDKCWCHIPEHFQFVELGAYDIMPNQMHAIIMIQDNGNMKIG